ncbi:hypothetical protein BD560DRAFT_422676 [Blakeslea trispora]|nr:hypothetical protein BD560DRAFT_422676 [Blakeslea trispora]
MNIPLQMEATLSLSLVYSFFSGKLMSKVVQHRLIQVQHATKKTSLNDSWTFLLDTQVPAIAVSHSCEKIIKLTNDTNVLQTIQTLQHLLLTCQDPLKTPVLLRTITRLLVLYDYGDRHPFIVLLDQRPDLYFNLLEELDYLITQTDQLGRCVMDFIHAVYLHKSFDTSPLLTRLHQLPFRPYLAQLILDYPLQKDSRRLLPLLDIVLVEKTIDDVAYRFLDRLLAAIIGDNAIMPYLVRLERIVLMFLDTLDPDLFWACMCFVLLKAQTVDQQELLLRLLIKINSSREVTVHVLRMAYLPLYQLLSEYSNDKEFDSLKHLVLQLISELDQKRDLTWSKTSSSNIQLLASGGIYGPLMHMMMYLDKIYTHTYPECSSESPLEQTFHLLFSFPFIFDEDMDHQCQVYTTMVHLSGDYKFPLFLFLLRQLQSSHHPRLITHLLGDVLLQLADTDDPIMTTKVLQVLLSAIPSDASSAMASLAVRALGRLYQRQPRVWQELKRVFSEWILRRKSSSTVRRKGVDREAIQMELAILTTMRDVCRFRPHQCAPDILPMAVSLLQSCSDLSMASLSILMNIINQSVQAGLAEPRSIWQIAVVYLAMFAAEQGAVVLLKEVCQFYALAGARDDSSEYYLQFKHILLKDYILPLVGDDAKIASYALEALACFPSRDIQMILPEKASDYLQQLVTNEPNPSQSVLLTTLVSDELDHMRRGLFKQDNHSIKPTEGEETVRNDRGQVIAERESELENIFKTQWEEARVAPGLRSGYALARLHTMHETSVGTTDMSKSHWYRLMVTCFTDISLTDHLLVRVSSVMAWKSFFKNALKQVGHELEATVSLLVKDLCRRLEHSTVPGATCNIFLALTGLIQMTQPFIPHFTTSCASDLIEWVMKHYISLAGSPLSHSAHLMSEEVQFAARFALGHFAGCIVSNKSLARQMYETLIPSATETQSRSRPMDTAVDLVQFANGYAAGHCIGAFSTYPAATEHTQELKEEGIKALLDYSKMPSSSDSRVLGILMGLASQLKGNQVEDDLLDYATESLELYLTGASVNRGRLFGSMWICSTGALGEDQVDYSLSSRIESTLAAASTDASLGQHFYHFTVPYATVQYHSHLFTSDDTFYAQAFEPLFHSIQSDDASSHYRIASLFALGSLLGIHYLSQSADFVLEGQHYDATAQRPGLDKLAAVAGLTVRSAPTGNLKSGRIAAVVCGKVIEHAQQLVDALQPTDETHLTSTVSSSSEPASYHRLNSNTSYLRAIFDQLNEAKPQTVEMLLKSLVHTPGPLPPVNWFPLMRKLYKIKPECCLQFASAHADTSFSLSEFLITQVQSALQHMSSCSLVFQQTDAFATLLTLAGLPSLQSTEQKTIRRGMNAVIKKIHLSENRLLELIDLIHQKFFSLDPSIQKACLVTLKHHLPYKPEEDKVQLVQSIRQSIFQSITLPLLSNNKQTEDLLRDAIDCSITQIDQLIQTSQDWNEMSLDMVYPRLVSLCELYHQQPDQKPLLMKHLSTAITMLIRRSGEMKDIWPYWTVISSCLSEDCSNLKERLSWILRVLDAFVVYASLDSANDQDLYHSLSLGLYQILNGLSLTFCQPGNPRMQFMETVYLLNTFILDAHPYPTEREQIIKRVFKLSNMTNKLQADDSAEFFECVRLGLPEDFLYPME